MRLPRNLLGHVSYGSLGLIVIYALLSSEVSANEISQHEGNTPSNPEAATTHLSTTITTHVTETPTVTSVTSSSSSSTESTQTTEGVKETILKEDEDVDAFLQKLFEEDEINQAESVVHPPKPTPLTAEEKAAAKRLLAIETELKRIDITGRHTKWEEKLQETGKAKVAELLETAKKMREDVITNMRSTPEMFDLVKKMQEAGLKQIEGTERVLQKMKDDGEKNEAATKKWSKVVEKIQQKLNSRTIETSEYLQKWFNEIMIKEKKIFEDAAAVVNQIADDGQADIGMDYAWLDDVTPHDWTRYHDLKRGAKKFVEEFEKIFTSDHDEMSENIVMTELLQVETAAVRVAAELNEGLDKLKKQGEKWLKGEADESSTTASTSTTSTAPSEPSTTSTASSETSTTSTASSEPPSETEEAAPSPVEEVTEETMPAPKETHATHEEL